MSGQGHRVIAMKQPSRKIDAPPLASLVTRARGEYLEMPGLRVSVVQACRLWHVDASTCERELDQLVLEGFLCKSDSGFYVAAGTGRR
ncbi:MAG: hypothetical protein QOE13_3175 [Gaiellaceae bacterium]|nr:hypothetical protein [Gaiellaceae bacterium]